MSGRVGMVLPAPARGSASRLRRAAGRVAAAGLLWALACTESLAGDVQAGRQKALKCQACHGLDGISKIPDAPNIAGQVEGYIVRQLHAFKAGVRKNDLMSLVAPGLSDQDIEDLAAYFSSIEIQVGKIPGAR